METDTEKLHSLSKITQPERHKARVKTEADFKGIVLGGEKSQFKTCYTLPVSILEVSKL